MDFSQTYAKETNKLLMRETLKTIIADAQASGMPTLKIADELFRLAGRHIIRHDYLIGSTWSKNAIKDLRRIRDGEWTSPEEITRFVGDRNLNARSQD